MTIRDIAIAFGFNVDEQSAKQAENTIKNLKNTATKLLGAIGIGFSLTKLNAIGEEFNGYNDKLRVATEELGDQAEIQQKVLKTANEIKASYGDTVDFASRLRAQDKALFDSVDKTLDYVELTTKAFKGMGRTEAEISSIQEVMNKTFATGTVASSDFLRIMKQAPEVVDYLCSSLDVTKDQLTSLVETGNVTSAALYDAFVNNADEINRRFDALDFSISDAMLNIRNQWGLYLDDLNSGLGVTNAISKAMINGFSKVMVWLKRGGEQLKRLVERLGGIENAFKLIAIAGGLVFAALNAGKIKAFLKSVTGLLGGVNKQMLLAQAKVLAILAVIALLVLLIDDFINFMKGNDSVIGELFQKAGIDADQARQTILNAWTTVKNFLQNTWGKIKEFGQGIWGGLQKFWEEHGEQIWATLSSAWNLIKTVLLAVWNFIKNRAISTFGALKAFWDRWGDQIIQAFQLVGQFLSRTIGRFLTLLQNLADFLSNVFAGDWESAWENIKTIGSTLLEQFRDFVRTIFEIIWLFIGEKVIQIKDTIVEGFQKAIDWIKALPSQAVTWGRDIIQGIIDGIKGKIGGVVDAVKGIGGRITDFLGFSVPDEGPLTKFPEWMPHFMQGLAQGIRDNAPLVTDALRALTGDMSAIVAAAGVGDITMRAAMTTQRSPYVTQNVEIENNFTGGDRAAQTEGARAMEKTEKDTTEALARALATGR